MENLWAPWRMQYILGPKPGTCVFCIPDTDAEDEERLILYRGRHSFVIMNKFPYNNGHLLVVPYRHEMEFSRLTGEESAEIMLLLQRSTEVLQQQMNAQGVNIGLNQGEAAGAGIRAHVHFHVVPRWNGDSSFIAVMQDTRLISQYLSEAWAKLKPCFNRQHQPEP